MEMFFWLLFRFGETSEAVPLGFCEIAAKVEIEHEWNGHGSRVMR